MMLRNLKKLLAAALLFTVTAARADEGMWLPYLIGKNYDEMKRLGLKLTKDDLYAINKASIKDAIVQFGGGCTAEVVSNQGLLITNHHCGYGSIAALSTVAQNYLANGFWAHNMQQELPCPGLSVIFLERVEDVTDRMPQESKKLTGDALTKKMDEVRQQMEKEASMDGKYVATVKDYFGGNQVLLLVYKKYTDVRLVGTPPESLGKFGGDTDNWMWPRHTADFSMFRIYADASNEPAEYKATNKPLRPKKFLPVSAKGVQEGDFAMIFGYPGRTNRYEISTGVDLALTETNPAIVKLRTERLAIMKRHMDADPAVDLKLSSNYAGIANYWKYYIGQSEQLKRLKVVDQKEQNELTFIKWAKKNNSSYNNLFKDYDAAYDQYRPYARMATYYSEGFLASGVARIASTLEPLATELDKAEPNADTVKKFAAAFAGARNAVVKGMDIPTDLDLMAATARLYYNDVPRGQLPDIYDRVIFKKFGGTDQAKTFNEYAMYVFENTFILDSAASAAFARKPTAAAIKNDPAAQYAISFVRNYNKNFKPKITAFQTRRSALAKQYIKGMMEYNNGKLFYPDANSTMRISYGTVAGYAPQDAVKFNYFTTLDGMVAKVKPGDQEFDAPKELLKLNKARDYGRWADKDGTLHTCFITNNDITGGNSGSPVINGNGEWIGAAFDGNWEAMSGDISFDKNYKRTIVVDARYVLWIIDKLGKADNLIKEMEIRY